jgi:hypothetical protein
MSVGASVAGLLCLLLATVVAGVLRSRIELGRLGFLLSLLTLGLAVVLVWAVSRILFRDRRSSHRE